MHPSLRRACLRALALLALELLVLAAIALDLGALSRWDLVFVASLCAALAPVFLLVEGVPRRGPARDLGLALVVLLWAGLTPPLALVQTGYTAQLLTRADLPRALAASERAGASLWAGLSETRALVAAWAPAIALWALLERRGVRRGAQVLGVLLGALALARLGNLGFRGLPLIRPLVASPWASPLLGTWLVLQPWTLACALPLVARLGSGSQQDLERAGLAGAGEGGGALLEGEVAVDQAPQ
ncbi:MAG: hypothetical protein AB7N76_25085 [Planctomycetota bacterium]